MDIPIRFFRSLRIRWFATLRPLLLLFPLWVLGGCAKPEESASSERYLYGGDVSALMVLETHGAVYRDAEGRPGDALEILRDAGMNLFRLRLFVDPDGRGIVTNDLSYTLEMARRVRATGASLLLDLHYSDTWADPAKQYVPAAWKDLDFEGLVAQVEDYTATTLEAFVAAGVAPDYVQLGNEITNGLLWPQGRVEYAEADDLAAWDRLAALQLAAHRGFRRTFPDEATRPAKILHIESTGNLPRTEWYLRSAMEHGVPFDYVGFSYYPEWHGSLDDLAATLSLAADLTGKPVLVAEVAYPWKDDAHWEKVENLAFPLTPAGQKEFLHAVEAVVRAVPQNRGRGLIWWYPEAVQTPGLNIWLGGSCALFDDDGRVLPTASSMDF